MSVKTIRFGTQFFPSQRKVLIKGPNTSVFNSTSLWSRSEKVLPSTTVKLFPTYSVVDGCIGDKRALVKWQEEKIRILGKEIFQKLQLERVKLGRNYHKAVENYFDPELISKQTLDEILSKTDDSIHGYLQSIYPFLSSTPKADCILEKTVVHHDLYYTGRFDAVLYLPDGPCLIDWKTTSERSAIATNNVKGDGLKGLYGYPKQLVAYVAAFNSDPIFKNVPQIKKAKIVIAYDSGSEADVYDVSCDALEELWMDWLSDLKKFWTSIEAGATDFVCRINTF